jgi:S-formylglutathione hydrolase FrmB
LKYTRNKSLTNRLRFAALILALLGALTAYYYYVQNKVRVETVHFSSNLLGRIMPYNVVLPPGYRLITSRRIRYPVLYLLHGWSSHYDAWLKETALEQYAADHRMIIITPEGQNGWYTDGAKAPSDRYETYITQELIPDVDSRFRTVPHRRGRAVAGYSMGGFGALKLGFKHPEMFSLAASMSGALDATTRTDDTSIMQTFGEPNSPTRQANDLQRLARDLPAERRSLLPYLYLDCGTDDPWFGANRAFADILLERKIVHEYRQLPGGHFWPYWDQQVREVLRVAEGWMVSPEE